MKKIVKAFLENKDKTMPILSFPSVNLLGISVEELISSAQRQVDGMMAIAKRCNVAASLNMMDLSVEAEAFGAKIRFSENEIPTVECGVIEDIEDVENLAVPKVGEKRTRIYIDGVKQAKEQIKDIPVFCGVIGPYSLAGRLFDMTELMFSCYDDPDKVQMLLEKTTEFLIEYIKAFKSVGADGVVMAEPAAGLLSPALAEEFSMPYVKKIFDAVNDDDFVICYHNCGDAVVDMAEQIGTLGADIYHFGNSINLCDIIPLLPEDVVVMGNVDPMIFKDGTVEVMRETVQKVYDECSKYDNFIISSGCDIPAESNWDNIDAYFEKVKELYA